MTTFLFDYDGTICNTLPTINYALTQTFSAFGILVPGERERLTTISSGITLHDTIVALHPDGAALAQVEIDAMVSKYREVYQECDARLTVLFDGTIELFHQLKQSNKTVIVISNKGIAAIERSLRSHGLYELTDLVIAEGAFPDLQLKAKPDPMMYRALISRQFNIENKQEVLMTGDTYADILFAKNCGIGSCWAAYGYGNAVECKKLEPDHTIQRISELINMI
jgi:phosphoglycolate phosphatase-like HAD superfamily hydrolase